MKLKLKLTYETWLKIMFWVIAINCIILEFTEKEYSLRHLSYDISLTIILVSIVFYNVIRDIVIVTYYTNKGADDE